MLHGLLITATHGNHHGFHLRRSIRDRTISTSDTPQVEPSQVERPGPFDGMTGTRRPDGAPGRITDLMDLISS